MSSSSSSSSSSYHFASEENEHQPQQPEELDTIPVDEKDEHARASYQLTVVRRCIMQYREAIEHMQSFPGTAKDYKAQMASLKRLWLKRFGLLNTEVADADRFSAADLIFGNMSAMAFASLPTFVPEVESVVVPTLLQIARCIASHHTLSLQKFWPTKQFLDTLFHSAAAVVMGKLAQPDTEAKQFSNDDWILDDVKMNAMTWVPDEVRYQLKLVPISLYSSGELEPAEDDEQPEQEQDASTFGMALRSSSSSSSSSPAPARRQIETKLIRVHTFAAPPVTSEGKYLRPMQLGSFWSESCKPEAVFIRVMSRVLHGFEFENWLLASCPCVAATSCVRFEPTIPMPTMKAQMSEWLADMCEIQSNDDFEPNFRKFVYEWCLPINTRLNAQTRSRLGSSASAFQEAIALLKMELGVDVASKLGSQFGSPLRSIGKSPNHAYYDLIVIHTFAYTLNQENSVDFSKTHLMFGFDLYSKRDVLEMRKRWGLARDPIVVYLCRHWYVHWVDSDAFQPGWLSCEDAFEACLVWLLVVMKNHKGNLITKNPHDNTNKAVNISKFTKQFLELNSKSKSKAAVSVDDDFEFV